MFPEIGPNEALEMAGIVSHSVEAEDARRLEISSPVNPTRATFPAETVILSRGFPADFRSGGGGERERKRKSA